MGNAVGIQGNAKGRPTCHNTETEMQALPLGLSFEIQTRDPYAFQADPSLTQMYIPSFTEGANRIGSLPVRDRFHAAGGPGAPSGVGTLRGSK